MARRYRRGRFRARASRKSGLGMSFGKIGFKLSPTFLLGAVLGFTNLDEKLPTELVTLGAVAPVSGIGAIKGACQGIFVGNLVQKFTGGASLGQRAAGFGI